MSLVRWDPFSEINSLFNRMLPRAARGPRLSLEDNGGLTVEWSPSADISETDKEYLIRAELPGRPLAFRSLPEYANPDAMHTRLRDRLTSKTHVSIWGSVSRADERIMICVDVGEHDHGTSLG
jgi:hypothetical protein